MDNLNSSDPPHTCCCGSMHVTSGAWWIATLMTISLVLNFFNLILRIALGSSGNVMPHIATIIIGGAVICCTFYALYTGREAFLLPYIILGTIGILLEIAMVVICFLALLTSNQFAHDSISALAGYSKGIDPEGIAAYFIAVFFFTIFIQMWFLWVVYKCYAYFRERSYDRLVNEDNEAAVSNAEP